MLKSAIQLRSARRHFSWTAVATTCSSQLISSQGCCFHYATQVESVVEVVGMHPFPGPFNTKILLHSTKLQSKRKSNLVAAGGALFGEFHGMDIQ
jgi:hypothetical protein